MKSCLLEGLLLYIAKRPVWNYVKCEKKLNGEEWRQEGPESKASCYILATEEPRRGFTREPNNNSIEEEVIYWWIQEARKAMVQESRGRPLEDPRTSHSGQRRYAMATAMKQENHQSLVDWEVRPKTRKAWIVLKCSSNKNFLPKFQYRRTGSGLRHFEGDHLGKVVTNSIL